MSGEIGNPDTARRLFDVTREKMRTRHMAYRTEQAYLQWIRRYIAFHQRRHPRDLGAAEVEQFLTCLAVERKVTLGAGEIRPAPEIDYAAWPTE